MSSKSLSLFAFGILALVLVMGLGSAATVFSDSFTNSTLPGWTITPTGGWTHNANNYTQSNSIIGANLSRTISTFGFNTIIVRYDRQLIDTAGAFESDDEFKASWSTDGVNFNTLEETLASTPSDGSFVSKTFNLLPSANNNANFMLRFECTTSAATEFCRVDNLIVEGTALSALTESAICAFEGGVTTNPDYLRVEVDSLNVIKGFGEDENWLPGDEVEVEIKIENRGLHNYDIDDISVEWGIAPDNLNDAWLVDFDEIDEFNLKDDDENSLTITFRVDEDDLEMSIDEFVGNDYNIVVRATGQIDDEDNLLGGIEDTCAAAFESVSIDEDNAVVLSNFDIPETLQCGQTYTITADAWNIGNDQEDEVSVDVRDRNREFIDDLVELGDIDEFDNTELSFDLEIPRDAEEGTYALTLEVLDQDGDVYEIGNDDDPVEYSFPLVVSGGCSSASQVTVTANTVSGGSEGQELVVRATVTNTGSTLRTYTLNVAGSESWASSFSVEPAALSLAAGQTGNVDVTIDVNDGTAGSQTFFLELVSGADLVRQPVSVTIAESKGFLGITGNVFAGGNSLIWGIGLLNLILVIVIIVVAVRIARRR